jgi:hypothetical protein
VVALQSGKATEDEVWNSIGTLTCHAPLAVLASLPNFLRRYTESTSLTVLSAHHLAVGTVQFCSVPTADLVFSTCFCVAKELADKMTD